MRVGPWDRISVLMKRDTLEPFFCPMKTERRWPQTNQEDSPEVKWKSLSHVQLCDPMDCTVHGILQARILEWVAFPFSRESSQPRDRTQVSCIAGGFFTSWVTRKAQEYWSGYPIPSPADLPDPGIELQSPALQADSLPTELWGKPEESPTRN